jgi:N-acetylglucosaminyldiphosphoundecaprenol N-acetyl-beta-D-mannosaminyltransferase
MSKLETCKILDYNVASCTLEQATDWCLEAVKNPGPQLLVTLNPEVIVRAEADVALKEVLRQADLTVADGVGVMWAARRLGCALPERVPGVELMTRLLERGGPGLRVYFLGGAPSVAEKAAEAAHECYDTVVVGVQHGYFKCPEEVSAVIKAVAESRPHLLLAGLGEGQELFLQRHRHDLGVPLMIGVGGALDVLSGSVKRTPAWTRKLGLEWAYRVGLDPQRWHRFPRLVRFMWLVYRWERSASHLEV